ncbi:RPS6 [Symbiodinium natans]|uniref:RPS6 protein n=1 Tax=Symbiodinium natans TaxID=878477 RepID=A0A812PKB6_9DINO|nr:RPS6 [Symbiodinium natans]
MEGAGLPQAKALSALRRAAVGKVTALEGKELRNERPVGFSASYSAAFFRAEELAMLSSALLPEEDEDLSQRIAEHAKALHANGSLPPDAIVQIRDHLHALSVPWLEVLARVESQTCFQDAIPDEDRFNISLDGLSMPLGIWQNAWDSSGIVSNIYGILASEKLGFKIYSETGPASELILGKLAGCDHAGFAITGNCGPPRRFHVSFENWLTGSPWNQQWLVDLVPYGSPVDLGSMGYEGKSGMFALGGSMDAALEDSGLSLDFFRSFNASWYDPSKYTAPLAGVSQSRLKTCATSAEVGYPGIAALYLAKTGDAGGVQDVNGATLLSCYMDRWWLAPACRHNTSKCVPVIMPFTAWGMPEMMQQAFWHNMPLALATAVDGDYVSLNRDLQSLLYTWIPDTTFFLDKPSQVIFPDHRPSEYANSIYKTMKTNTVLSKWAAAGFREAADKAFAVARNLQMTFEEVMDLLSRHVESPNPNTWQTACEWLKDNEPLWKAWIPNETECSAGKGLVDDAGNFVQSRGLAVNCQFCPVGTYSAESEAQATRVCIPCEPGTSQALPGESQCIPCEPGSLAPQEGATECEPCPLGKYASGSRTTACSQCGNHTNQIALWTTSKAVTTTGQTQWIQVQGATSISYCTCIEGFFLFQDRCEPCITGSSCPGSNQLELLPGYFSTEEDPGAVFRCFGEPARCPGGIPGTCALGRDSSSVACSKCVPGTRADGGECTDCATGDFFLLVVVCFLVVCAIVILYFVLMRRGAKSSQPGSLLIAALGLGQMVTVIQQLTVIQQFKIEWGEPFSGILASLDLFAFDLDLISISCVAPMSPVSSFTMRTLLVLVLFSVACLVHFLFVACNRQAGLQLNVLGSTIGTLFMVFFISVCSSLLAPFRCNVHPNGLATVQAYHQVLCNGQDDHLSMALIGGFSCLLPVGFLAICSWITLVQLPKWLVNGEVKLIRSCSFLFMRFRPGAEVFSVLFSVRNALVVLCPLISSTSGRVLCMNLLLYASLVLVAFGKPWRAMVCNFLDLFLVTGMLVILGMGSLFVTEVESSSTTAICVLFSLFMFLSILGAIVFGVVKHVSSKYRKPFWFFICHQKVAAGSYARLMKMHCQSRGARFTTFVDCDDLNDLTKLFSYVGQDTQTLVILGSPQILTRKWCVGEMVTGRLQRVHTALLTFPGFEKPDAHFIRNYTSIVPDITELTNYNISLNEVEETLRRLVACVSCDPRFSACL